MKPLEDAEVLIVNRNYILFDIRGVQDEIVYLPDYVNGLFSIEAYYNKTYFMAYSSKKNNVKEINFRQKLSVGRYALAYFKKLKSINGIITSIGIGAFKGCTFLENLTMQKLKVLPDYSLMGCGSLLNLDLRTIEVMQPYSISNPSKAEIMRIKARDLREVKRLESRGVILIDITDCQNPIKVHRQSTSVIFLRNGIILDWTGLPSINADGEYHLGWSKQYRAYELDALLINEDFLPEYLNKSNLILEDTPRIYRDKETYEYYSYL